MGRTEKLFEQPSAPSSDLDWRSSVPIDTIPDIDVPLKRTRGPKMLRNKNTRNHRLRSHYGLSLDEFRWILLKQDGCAICGRVPQTEEEERGFVVDHDHSCCPTPKTCGCCIRGVLCSSCNCALGQFGDNLIALEMAARYLRRYEKTKCSPLAEKTR